MHISFKMERTNTSFSSASVEKIKKIEVQKKNKKINEENLHFKKKKYVCKICSKKFQFSSNYEKHKNQYVAAHKYFKCCNKIEEFESSHKCNRMPLKSHAIKKNQMNVKNVGINEKEKCIFDNGNNEDNSYESDDKCDIFDENSEKKKSLKIKTENENHNENFKYKIYKCQECLQLFKKFINLSRHLKLIHNKQGKFKCQICDEDFNTNEDLESHAALHGPEDKIICKGCKKTFNTLKLYYIHAKQNPGIHCFICKLCLRKFPTELMLDQHVCICQNGKPLHCACGKEFTRYKDVIDHSKGTKPFNCCSCPHLANSLTAYIRHLRKHSKQKPYQCTKCDMKFAVIDFLNIHNKKFHSESENVLIKEQNIDANQLEENIQTFCDEKFKITDEQKRNSVCINEQKDASGDERVQCPDCGKLLKRNRLENHRNTHKTSASLCPECGKLFDTRFKLTQHIITAHNNEPVKCEVCTKVLKTKKILNEHMKTHLKSELGGRIPQAICPMCGLGLAQKGSLARHILLTHEKHKIIPCNKTYTCQECSTVLPNRAKYYSHRRMHRAMIDRFPCEICGREFNKKQNLKRHIYLLHDETRVLADPIFKCQFCTRCFREKKNLKRHYKMVHKVEDIV